MQISQEIKGNTSEQLDVRKKEKSQLTGWEDSGSFLNRSQGEMNQHQSNPRFNSPLNRKFVF